MLNYRRKIATYEEFVAEIEPLLQTSMMLLIRDVKVGNGFEYWNNTYLFKQSQWYLLGWRCWYASNWDGKVEFISLAHGGGEADRQWERAPPGAGRGR